MLTLLATLNVLTVFILSSHFLQGFRFCIFGQRQQDDESVVCTTFLLLPTEFRMSLAPLLMFFNIKDFRFCKQNVVMRTL